MKKTRFSEEQIIAVLREQEGGMKTADVCRKHVPRGETDIQVLTSQSTLDGRDENRTARGPVATADPMNRKETLLAP